MPATEEPVRILLYIENKTVAEVTSFRLRLLGMRPQIADDQTVLTRLIDESLPDGLIIDLDANEQSGLQVVERLTSNEVTSRIPILCMSAEGDLPHAEEAFHSGARDFLVVPFDPITLEHKVISMIENARIERLITESANKKKRVPASR